MGDTRAARFPNGMHHKEDDGELQALQKQDHKSAHSVSPVCFPSQAVTGWVARHGVLEAAAAAAAVVGLGRVMLPPEWHIPLSVGLQLGGGACALPEKRVVSHNVVIVRTSVCS